MVSTVLLFMLLLSCQGNADLWGILLVWAAGGPYLHVVSDDDYNFNIDVYTIIYIILHTYLFL